MSGRNSLPHLDALAVVEEHVAQLLGHHVQVPLLALVGSGEHVEFGEVRGHVVERSGDSREAGSRKKIKESTHSISIRAVKHTVGPKM